MIRARPWTLGVGCGLALALVFTGAAGCNVFDPKVGLSQESCGEDAIAPGAASEGYGGGAAAKTSGAYGASSGAASSSTVGICAPDAGSACDQCESRFCCPTRVACYGDPVCICADRALDRCLKAKAPGEDAGIDACWDTFEENGTVEAERAACERTWCPGPCGVE
jgi:hypothetical protein